MAWPRTGRYSPRKGAKRLPEKQRQRILRRYPHCQLAIIGICTGKSVEVHHVQDAADGGSDDDFNPDSTPQLVGVCRECHRYVSARNSAARAPTTAPDYCANLSAILVCCRDAETRRARRRPGRRPRRQRHDNPVNLWEE
jgi:hypothetical protein